jgi:hypothetical protein
MSLDSVQMIATRSIAINEQILASLANIKAKHQEEILESKIDMINGLNENRRRL